MSFYRKCKKCGQTLIFDPKNLKEVKPCFCKGCRKWKEMQDTEDISIYVLEVKDEKSI